MEQEESKAADEEPSTNSSPTSDQEDELFDSADEGISDHIEKLGIFSFLMTHVH